MDFNNFILLWDSKYKKDFENIINMYNDKNSKICLYVEKNK